jgi:dihydrofolate reductase
MNMRKLVVFDNVTLDGYFTGADGDFRWAHEGSDDSEFSSFVAENARGGGELILGRTTYELMAAYWPTPMAKKNDPVVADRMNKMPKIVFSRTLREATWSNTTVVNGDLESEVRRIKNASGEGIAILGSGSIVAQLAPHGLIDEYQLIVNPVILGSGRSLFEGVETRLNLTLTNSRSFRNGKVFLCYVPAR